MLYRLVSAAYFASLAAAATITVAVGQGGFTFSPSSVTGAVGDTVTFTCNSGIEHNVVQSTFGAPCSPVTGGFSIQPQGAGSEFSITLATTDPLYFYCSVSDHCAEGMVGIINPGAHSEAEFASAASMATSSQPPSGVQGGVLVAGGSTTTGAAAATAAGAGGSSSAGGSSTATGTAASTSKSVTPASSSAFGYMPTSVPAAFAVLAGAVAALV